MTLGPLCSLRDTFAFLRDACVFSANGGLGYGDVYRVRIPGYHVHIVTDPSLIEQILIGEGEHFEKSRIYWRELRRIVGDAMGSLEGDRWQYLRRLQQPFFTPRAVSRYLPTAQEITTAHLQRLEDSLEGRRDVPILEILSELSLRILLAVLFRETEAAPPAGIWERIVDGEAIIAWRSKFPWRPATAWLTGANQRAGRHRAFFGAYADRLQRAAPEAREAPEAASLLDVLVRARQEPATPRFPATLLRNEIIVHLGAGTETQGGAEGWILYLLWKHPEQLQRVRDEVRRVAGGSLVSLPHLEALTYTRQVVREGLRLYPPSYALVRDCIRPTRLGGIPVRRGQTFFISLYALHRNPRLWSEPDRFDPERFGGERAAAICRFRYLPFGGGKHVCIGQHLAVPCMLLAIGQFVQRFDWAFAEREVRPVGLSTLKPTGAFTATLSLRR